MSFASNSWEEDERMDLFACHAMAQLVAKLERGQWEEADVKPSLAVIAYDIAEAMMTERQKRLTPSP